jgi:release factor glutamine methyltransferase
VTRKQTTPEKIVTISNAVADTHQRLTGLTDTPGLDARVLLAHICRQDKSWLLAHPDAALPPEQQKKLEEMLEQLINGVPLPYVIGKWEFYGLSFKLTPDVLIPRPETELLVETALERLAQHPGEKLAAEAGTGSGCIAISLAVNHPALTITATDISSQALTLARENAKLHNVSDRINFMENDLFNGMTGQFDLICANLPYIPTDTLRQLDVYQREPTMALDGGTDGLDLIRQVLDQAVDLLADHGLILLEIEDRQEEAVMRLAQERFPEAQVEVKLDLAGKPRLLVVERLRAKHA